VPALEWLTRAHPRTQLAEAAAKASKNEPAEEELAEVGMAPKKSKPAFQALATFLLEAAKFNSSDDELTSMLEEAGILSRASYLIGLVNRDRPTIRATLLNTTFHFQQVLDVQWRVDHSVRSKYQDQIGEPTFLISIITAGGDGVRAQITRATRTRIAPVLRADS
jgi:hypothetical protein